MCGGLNLSHGLHEGVLYGDVDVRARVAFGKGTEGHIVFVGEFAGGVADGEFKHFDAAGKVGDGDVDTALETVGGGEMLVEGYLPMSEGRGVGYTVVE